MNPKEYRKLRQELLELGQVELMNLAFEQKENFCILFGHCPFGIKYKGMLFCVSELLRRGCQREQSQKEEAHDSIKQSNRDQLHLTRDHDCEHQGVFLWD